MEVSRLVGSVVMVVPCLMRRVEVVTTLAARRAERERESLSVLFFGRMENGDVATYHYCT